MQFAKRFLDKFSSLIVTVLSCFDRVIFKGYLPFHNEGELNSWVDYTLRIRRIDFVTQLEKRSEELVEHAKAFAAKVNRPYEYRQGRFRKEQFIQDIIRRDNLTDCKKKREPGARVKHRVKDNWIKMYDKFGLVLRVETVINSPREFRVRRKRIRKGQPTMVWCPMNKGVANLPSYQRVCRATNDRYLNALSVVNDPTPAYQQVADLTESKTHQGRRYAGFNPARKDDVRLFQAVLSGAHELRGFHNCDIRESLHGVVRDPTERRRRANAVSRMLKRLHVRGLIARIPRTRRWRVTSRGHSLLGAMIRLHYHGIPLAA